MKRKELCDIAAVYIKMYSIFDSFNASSEYLDSLSWSGVGSTFYDRLPADCMELSSAIETIISRNHGILYRITKYFEGKLLEYLNESSEFQLQELGISFKITNVNDFVATVIENTPTCSDVDERDVLSILVCWLSDAYKIYQTEHL